MTELHGSIPIPSVRLHGVHHTARPTWKLRETLHFYRDLLGLPLIHAVSARGWGQEDHADFIHFFFDSGNGSTIAFFYYIGTDCPEWLRSREHYQYRANHTAWRVHDEAELRRWRQRVEAVGIPLRYQVRHEVIESIYFTDPNGYPIEITYQTRPFVDFDILDAALTVDAAAKLEQDANNGGTFTSIDSVWKRKATSVDSAEHDPERASIFVLDVPEFASLVGVAQRNNRYPTTSLGNGYTRIDGNPNLEFRRKELGVKPAVWNGILTGGLSGEIVQFDMEVLSISPEKQQ
jgi:catechol 2,3-dioxygenase-like lactoylglutathione lyase family enzyme